MDNQAIFIVCAADENFVMPLAVMLKSLLINLNKHKKVIIYILDSGIEPASGQKLANSIKSEQSDAKFIKIDTEVFRGLNLRKRMTLAVYSRLLMESVLPDYIEKVIYLDSDLVINEDISKLWDMPIGEHHLLAVQDQGQNALYVSSPLGLKNYKELGIQPERPYFNSGVMVINLVKWRRDRIGQKAIEYGRQNIRYFRFHDQEALNALLHDSWGKLDPRWNVMMQMHTNSSWDAGPVKDKETYRRVIKHPYIIHFNQIHPWMPYSNRPYKPFFFHYLDMTEWRGWRPRENFLKAIIFKLKDFLKQFRFFRTVIGFLKKTLGLR